MAELVDSKLLRIGVFYDGNYFSHVSNYYRYEHPRQARISIGGLHDFIKHHVSILEGVDTRLCQIVDAHFFRGRYSARDAEAQQKLFADRVLDDILMSEGVVTHYLPLRNGSEKGIDVWLALEAYELAVYKKFNVIVLVAGDGDFVPLIRKVNTLGTRVVVLGWDYQYMDQNGNQRETTTSVNLLNEAAYPVLMHEIIDNKTRKNDGHIKGLFVDPPPIPSGMPQFPRPLPIALAMAPSIAPVVVPATIPPSPAPYANGGGVQRNYPVREEAPQEPVLSSEDEHLGEVQFLKNGYGFIRSESFPGNIFFPWSQLTNIDFVELEIGDQVAFKQGEGERGTIAMEVRVLYDHGVLSA